MNYGDWNNKQKRKRTRSCPTYPEGRIKAAVPLEETFNEKDTSKLIQNILYKKLRLLKRIQAVEWGSLKNTICIYILLKKIINLIFLPGIIHIKILQLKTI